MPESITLKFHDSTRDYFFGICQQVLKLESWYTFNKNVPSIKNPKTAVLASETKDDLV